MRGHYDVVIVGGGHNGLVCGAYLAKAGAHVCVVEGRDVLGGSCVTEELWPGFRASTASYNLTLLPPKIIHDLNLLELGLEILPPTPIFEPFPDGRHVVLWEDQTRMYDQIAKFCRRDANQYAAYLSHLKNLAPMLRRLMWETPPELQSVRWQDRWELLKFLWRNRSLASRASDLQELLTASANHFLRRWFSSDDVIAILGFYVSMSGSITGFNTPGSASLLIRPFLRDNTTPAGGWGIPRGGMGAVVQAIARAGQSHGMNSTVGDPVTEIVVVNNRAEGVVLFSGREIRASVVVSSADLRTTFERLIDTKQLPTEFSRRVRAFHGEGALFKMNLALESLPRFSAFDSEKVGFPYPALIRIGPSLKYFEKAFEEARGGSFSTNPFLVVQITSAFDPAMAPTGKHSVSVLGGFAPYTLGDRSWQEAKSSLIERTLATLEEYAPNIGSSIMHSQLLTPTDLESIFKLPLGHIHHGDMSLDQAFLGRPVAGFARYRSPIHNLYLCGSSTHPGGGVTGIPGHNAAREILLDRKGWDWKLGSVPSHTVGGPNPRRRRF